LKRRKGIRTEERGGNKDRSKTGKGRRFEEEEGNKD
jgi:hypothetical protein